MNAPQPVRRSSAGESHQQCFQLVVGVMRSRDEGRVVFGRDRPQRDVPLPPSFRFNVSRRRVDEDVATGIPKAEAPGRGFNAFRVRISRRSTEVMVNVSDDRLWPGIGSLAEDGRGDQERKRIRTAADGKNCPRGVSL